jgi:hypothetical protein
MHDPASFEEAMSILTLAIGHIDRHWPQTQCQSSRLAEQVGRLDRTWAKSASAILHKGDVA